MPLKYQNIFLIIPLVLTTDLVIANSLEDAADRLINATEKATDASKAVTEDTVQLVADSTITTDVKSRLVMDENIPFSVTVSTLNGVVYLKGKVSTQADKERAVKIASEVNGVQRVDSSGLTVFN